MSDVPNKPTRLWVATIYVKMPEEMSLEGIRFQKVLVVPFDWKRTEVMTLAQHFADEHYGDECDEVWTRVERVRRVDNLAQLALSLTAVDATEKCQRPLTQTELPTLA